MKFPSPIPVGQTFGRLTVVAEAEKPSGSRNRWVRCACSCGAEKTVRLTHIHRGRILSCGCLRREVSRDRCTKHGLSLGADGRPTRLFLAWVSMRRRCTDRNSEPDYGRYGGRGIRVCDEWREDFEAFHKWATTSGYADNLTLDRIDNNCGYSPDNCRWVSRGIQNNNRRSNRLVTFRGETKTLADWARELNMCPSTLGKRLRAAWPIAEALTTPPSLSNRVRRMEETK